MLFDCIRSIQSRYLNREITCFHLLASFSDGHGAGLAEVIEDTIVIDKHHFEYLRARSGRRDIKRYYFLLPCRHLSLDDSRVLRILIELLSAEIEIQIAEEAVFAVVLDGGIDLNLRAHFQSARK